MDLSIKGVLIQVGRGVVHCGHFSDNGGWEFSNADAWSVCCEKLKIYRRLWYVRTDKEV